MLQRFVTMHCYSALLTEISGYAWSVLKLHTCDDVEYSVTSATQHMQTEWRVASSLVIAAHTQTLQNVTSSSFNTAHTD